MPAKVRVPSVAGLPRERLDAQLANAVDRHRLTLVIAPAGSGKTTLLARFAAAASVPIAWYRAETWDDDPARLLRHLEASLTAALPGLSGQWGGVEAAAAALDRWTGGRAVLAIDDLHALEGTAAEETLSRLVDYAPPWLAIVAASRVRPGFNLPRLRVWGELFEIEVDDLRFRAWEVERLFRDYYGDPVPPGELAILARRTEGWAAGLQLFHLATRGKSADERRRILAGVGSSSRLLREYLARNVLAELPEELRRFLVETSVLVRLSADLCDRLLERRGSGAILEELARRQIFTVAIDDVEPAYRYHEVLRSHLDRMLVEEVGEAEARARHRRAAELLEEAGALADALVAYCRAEDWTAVGNLVGKRGEQVTDESSLRLELLPPALVRDSPWLALASARRARAEGRWTAAAEAYVRAEVAFGTAAASLVCRQERAALAAWLEPGTPSTTDWSGVLRLGLVRDPLAVARDGRSLTEGEHALVRGLLLLAAGEALAARRALENAAHLEQLSPALAAGAAIGGAIAGLLAGDGTAAGALDEAIDAADRAGFPWLARIGRAVTAITGAAPGADARFGPEDPWGNAFAALVEAWAPAGSGAAATEARIGAAERAATLFRRLGAGVLEALARGLVAIGHADAGRGEAREAALAAESTGRATGSSAARLLAYAALARIDPVRAAEYELLATEVASETGLLLPPSTLSEPATEERAPAEDATRGASFRLAPRSDRARPASGSGTNGATAAIAATGLQLRVLGGFGVTIDGRPLALEGVRPRARAVLRFLAIRPGSPVHREVIQDALWRDADRQAAAASLQVAISSLRSALAETVGPAGGRMLAREGDTYRLEIEPERVDVGRFEAAIARANAPRTRSGVDLGAFAEALEAYAGDLLPQDGPADWVVDRREQLRRQAVEAATILAERSLMQGDLHTAIRACRRGLEIDRFHDPLWRVLIAAQDQAGDAGAASRDRRDYAAVLEGLGLRPDGVTSSL